MATSRTRRRGVLLISHGALLGHVLCSAFFAWVSAGITEATTQQAGLRTLCERLTFWPFPGEPTVEQCEGGKSGAFYYEAKPWFPKDLRVPWRIGLRLREETRYPPAIGPWKYSRSLQTPWWNSRWWLYEITGDRRFLRVLWVNIYHTMDNMSDQDWQRLFASLRFAGRVEIHSHAFDDHQMQYLAACRNLEFLSLRNYHTLKNSPVDGSVLHRDIPITGEGLSYLKGLRRLRHVTLDDIHLTEDGRRCLGSLTQLESLRLSTGMAHATDEDATLAHLTGLRNLKSLQIGASRVTDAGLAHVGKMPWLKSLDVAGTGISDAGLKQLSGLSHLQRLDLSHTAVTDQGIEHISRLTTLTHLDLRKVHLDLDPNETPVTEVTDRALEHIARLKNLTYLNLNETQVTDAGLPRLQSLKKLETLYLCGTRATGPAIRKLVEALPRVEAMWYAHGWTEESDDPPECETAKGKEHDEWMHRKWANESANRR